MTEQKTKEILVIEDEARHLADAKQVIGSAIKHGSPISPEYVSDYNMAISQLDSKRYSGILSDVFFPTESGGSPLPNGTEIAQYALQNRIPVILCTSTYHHGSQTEPVSKWVRQKGFELVDVAPSKDLRNNEEVGESKNWMGALFALGYFIELLEQKPEIISEGRVADSQLALSSIISGHVNNMSYYERERGRPFLENTILEGSLEFEVLGKYCPGLIR